MKTTIYTIFGGIEELAAQVMIGRYQLRKIEVRDFPPDVERTNEHGASAKFAIIIPGERMVEFDDLIADLRA